MYCTNCGNEFDGKFCPKCGAPASDSTKTKENQPMQQINNVYQQPKKKRGCLFYVLIVVAVFIVLGVIFAMMGGEDDSVNVTTEDKKSVSEEKNNEDKEKDKEIKIGSTFDNGELKVTVKDADLDFKEYDEWSKPDKGKKYIKVSFKFENIADSGDQYVSIYDFDCYADNTNCEQEFALGDSDFMNTNLSPGRNVSFDTYYVVPKDAKDIELEYTESFWSDKKVLIKLKK